MKSNPEDGSLVQTDRLKVMDSSQLNPPPVAVSHVGVTAECVEQKRDCPRHAASMPKPGLDLGGFHEGGSVLNYSERMNGTLEFGIECVSIVPVGLTHTCTA